MRIEKISFKNKKFVIYLLAIFLIAMPYNIYANESDSNTYDISWYDKEITDNYKITNAKELMGLSYLVNEQKVTFENKNIELINDIDLTNYNWKTINEIFKGNICGNYRIILNFFDREFIKNRQLDKVLYSFNVLKNDEEVKKVIVKYPYNVSKLKEEDIDFKTVFLDNKILDDNTNLLELNLDKDDIIKIYYRYNFVEDYMNEKVPIYCESGDSIDRIRKIYASKLNVEENRIILKYNDKILQNGRILADYNIQKEEVIKGYVKVNIKTLVEGLGNIKIEQKDFLLGDKLKIELIPNNNYILNNLFVNGINKTEKIVNDEIIIDLCENDILIKANFSIKEKIINPQTSDNVIIYITMFIISLFGLFIVNKIKKKNK